MDQIQAFLNLRTYWWRKTPRTNILKELFRHIYIEKGQIKCFNFSFLGWGLKVTYNSDFFEKLRSPPWVFKCPNLNFRLFCFVLEKTPKFSRFLVMRSPLSFQTFIVAISYKQTLETVFYSPVPMLTKPLPIMTNHQLNQGNLNVQ